jgi:fatty acid desaturase
MFRGNVKSTGYPLHSPVSPSLPLPASPCAITFQLDSTNRTCQPAVWLNTCIHAFIIIITPITNSLNIINGFFSKTETHSVPCGMRTEFVCIYIYTHTHTLTHTHTHTHTHTYTHIISEDVNVQRINFLRFLSFDLCYHPDI